MRPIVSLNNADLLARLTAQIEYAEKAASRDATAPSQEAKLEWIKMADALRTERAKVTGSL